MWKLLFSYNIYYLESNIKEYLVYGIMRNHIAEAHMTTRGQIALPKKVKEKLGAEDKDYILFYEDNGKIYIEAGTIVPKK
jgi:hypothetical protein